MGWILWLLTSSFSLIAIQEIIIFVCVRTDFIPLGSVVDPDPAFQVNPDTDPIWIQGFDDQQFKKKTENFQKLHFPYP